MQSLNQLASHIAGIVGRQSDHALKERIKYSYISTLNNRIKQRIEKYGYEESLIIPYEIGIIETGDASLPNFTVFETTADVPLTIRHIKDAPFQSVSFIDNIPFSYRTKMELMFNRFDSKGLKRYYTYDNNTIKLYVLAAYEDVSLDTAGFTSIVVKAIWEDLADIFSPDDDNYKLPYPDSLIESVTLEILKTEFNYIPPELEVKH